MRTKENKKKTGIKMKKVTLGKEWGEEIAVLVESKLGEWREEERKQNRNRKKWEEKVKKGKRAYKIQGRKKEEKIKVEVKWKRCTIREQKRIRNERNQ